jgi:multimeric flavodoxin WrbA
MSEMKVLGIVGSPRREGHTARLVEAVLEGANEAGHEAEIFYLSELDIGPLEAEGGRIAYPEDDMVRLHPHIESMGAIVLGTPIYYDHVSARTKLFIDRLHYFSRTHGEEYRRRFPEGVKAVTAITYEAGGPDRYDYVLDWMKRRLEYYWKMKVVAGLKAESTGRNPVEERLDLLKKAKEIGRSL